MATQARSPLDIAASNWAERINSIAGAGVSHKLIRQRIQPIVEDDLRKVRQGSQPMAVDAAVLSAQSALSGKPAFGQAKDQSWSPDDLVGDVVGDIGDLTWRGIPALIKYAYRMPENIENTATALSKGHSKADNKWLVKHGYEPNTGFTLDPSAWASAIRNVAKTPVLGVIPGVHTIAGLTTAEGRAQLAHHPVSTALDVAPVAGALGKGAGLVRAAAGADAAAEGSAAAALFEGHPVKAAYRGAVPEAARAVIADKTVAGLRKVGLDPQSFGLAKGLNVEERKTRLAMEKALKDNPIMDDIAALPDDERALLTHEAAYPDEHPDVSVEHTRLLERVQAFNDMLAEQNPNLTFVERTSEVPMPKPKPYEPDLSIPEGLPEDARFVVRDANGQTAHDPRDVMPLNEEGAASARSAYESGKGRKPGVRVNIEGAAYENSAEDAARLEASNKAVNEEYETATPERKRAIMDEAKSLQDELAKKAKEHKPAMYREGQFEPTQPVWEDPVHNPDIDEAQYVLMDEKGNKRLVTKSTEDVQKWVNDAAYKGEQLRVRVELPEGERRGGSLERRTGDREGTGRRADDKARADNVAKQQELLDRYDSATTDAERIAIMDEAKALHEETRNATPATQTVTRRYVYPVDSEVAKAHAAMNAADEKVDAVASEADQTIRVESIEQLQRDMRDVQRRNRTVANAQRRVDSAREAVARAQNSVENGRGKVGTLERQMDRLQKAMDNLEHRQGQAREAGAKLENTRNRRIDAAHRRVEKATNTAEGKKAAFDEAFKQNPPANMVPILERIMKEKIGRLVEAQPWPVDSAGNPIEAAGEVTAQDYVNDATKQLERHDQRHLLSEQEYADIRREVMTEWQKVADEGYHPVWTHNVEVERAGKPPSVKPLPLRHAKETQVAERVGDLTPHINDIAVSMTHALAEHLRAEATKVWLNDYIEPHVVSWDDIADDLHREVDRMVRKKQIPRGVDEAGALQMALEKHFVDWNPDRIFESGKPRLSGTATVGSTNRYLPRNIAKIGDDLIGYEPGGIVKAAASTTKLYKTSIMAFSLKHMAHILFGGTAFLMLRGGLEEIVNIPKAIKMVRDGEMPVGLNRYLDPVENADQLFQYAAGNKLGEMYAKSLGRVAKAKYKFDEFVTNVQRSIAYLGEESRALKRGASADEAIELGLRHAEKTLVDVDSMNPFERNVLKQVMPFYAFMRHTLRYILTYPIDHPLRASILSRIADIEQKDWSSGLPEQFQSLFFLGSPDKDGNVTGIEMRQFNPFRDTGSYFTLAGFMKAIHPGLQIPLTIAGLDKFSGAPSLYPQLEYDKQTGNLTAKRPKNAPWIAATTLVPELGLVDQLAGITQEMRDLKERDPEAFKRRMFQQLFIPFEPKTINVPQENADVQQSLLKIAQQDVSNALQTGDTRAINRYPIVPYQGELVDPNQLTNVINYLKQIRPDVAPRSAIPSVKLSKL